MKLWNKILTDDSNTDTDHLRNQSLPFVKDMHQFVYVDKLEEADIVCALADLSSTNSSLQQLKPHQILLVMGLFHIDHHSYTPSYIDYYINRLINEFECPTNKIIFTHKNKNNLDSKYAYFDMMFYRQKLYFTDYQDEYDLSVKTWTSFCNKEIYSLEDIHLNYQRSKNILNPSKIYEVNGMPLGPRMKYRIKLREFLLKHNDMRGYINDTRNGACFFPNNPSKDVMEKIIAPGGGIWYPIGDVYYNSSYVSAYIETITEPFGAKCATEKTFDPLIKGHFILPYSIQNFIASLKTDYGFTFPIWIDYSYDEVSDSELRFEKYMESVKKIIDMPLDKLHQLAFNDIEILKHNRQVFFDTPYVSFYDTIQNCIKFNSY